MSTIMHDSTTVPPVTGPDIGDVVKAIREGLSVEVSELAKASGLRCKRIEAIEAGRATTADERHDIAAGVASLLTTHTERSWRAGHEYGLAMGLGDPEEAHRIEVEALRRLEERAATV